MRIKAACVLALLAVMLASAGPAWAQVPFDAVYEVRVDGKPRLETRIRLFNQDDRWVLESATEGTGGLARFLKVASAEHSSGSWVDGRYRPQAFSHHSKVAGKDERWSAAFDWSSDQVETRVEDTAHTLEITPETVDPLSLTLMLGRLLADGGTDFEVRVVDEDAVDQHRYRSSGPSQLQTALGCLEVVALERIRENSKRYSTGWYAQAHHFLPVRVQHGKRGGKEFDMRIVSLSLDGQPLTPGEDCPD
ncbi:MAG: DUF3108 domain-containing protein [Xanthomonadales bacterium]|nr:DUF3108 domain-containing protein [Xanthomonadales bacterium]